MDTGTKVRAGISVILLILIGIALYILIADVDIRFWNSNNVNEARGNETAQQNQQQLEGEMEGTEVQANQEDEMPALVLDIVPSSVAGEYTVLVDNHQNQLQAVSLNFVAEEGSLTAFQSDPIFQELFNEVTENEIQVDMGILGEASGIEFNTQDNAIVLGTLLVPENESGVITLDIEDSSAFLGEDEVTFEEFTTTL